MRIISGSMRGTKLYTLDGLDTRPTLDRVKEALFSIINFRIEEATVLDLFAGSGALGLEAISRGAKVAVLCDSSHKAMNIIKQNVEKTRTLDKTILIGKSYEKALKEVEGFNLKFDIIFLDPPYESGYIKDAVDKIIEFDLLKSDGVIIIETDNKQKTILDINTEKLDIYDEKQYGRVYLILLNRKRGN